MTRSRIAAIPILVIAIIVVAAATGGGIRDGLERWTASTAVVGVVLFFTGIALAARKG